MQVSLKIVKGGLRVFSFFFLLSTILEAKETFWIILIILILELLAIIDNFSLFYLEYYIELIITSTIIMGYFFFF